MPPALADQIKIISLHHDLVVIAFDGVRPHDIPELDHLHQPLSAVARCDIQSIDPPAFIALSDADFLNEALLITVRIEFFLDVLRAVIFLPGIMRFQPAEIANDTLQRRESMFPQIPGILRLPAPGGVIISRQNFPVVKHNLSHGAVDRDIGAEPFRAFAAIHLRVDVACHIVFLRLILLHLIKGIGPHRHGLSLHRLHGPAVGNLMIQDPFNILLELDDIDYKKGAIFIQENIHAPPITPVDFCTAQKNVFRGGEPDAIRRIPLIPDLNTVFLKMDQRGLEDSPSPEPFAGLGVNDIVFPADRDLKLLDIVKNRNADKPLIRRCARTDAPAYSEGRHKAYYCKILYYL